MTTRLHQVIEAIAGHDPAAHVSRSVLVRLITRRLNEAIRTLVGIYHPYPNTGSSIQIGLKACNYDPLRANWTVNIGAVGAQFGEFQVESTARFTADFAVTKTNDPTVGLFVVQILVRAVVAAASISGNKLSIQDISIDFDTALTRDNNFDANLIDVGLTEAQVLRLEGLVEGSIAPTAVRNVFLGAPAIDLRSLFPMVSFRGQTELTTAEGGVLIIARDGVELNEDACCPCGAAAPPIAVTPGPPTLPTPPNTVGSIPVTIGIPPPGRQIPENNLSGELSLYLPKPTLSSAMGGPFPAVTGYMEDNGFIGWSLDYTVAFTKVELSIQDPRATIVLKVRFYVSGHGDVTVDVPCIGRQTAGRFWATNRRGVSELEVGVTPTLSPDGKITFKGELLSLSVADFQVDVVTVTAALLGYFLGYVGGLIGFVFDRILSLIIANELPRKLSSGIRDIVGKMNWTIVDLSKFELSAFANLPARFVPAISRSADSGLFGFQVDG